MLRDSFPDKPMCFRPDTKGYYSDDFKRSVPVSQHDHAIFRLGSTSTFSISRHNTPFQQSTLRIFFLDNKRVNLWHISRRSNIIGGTFGQPDKKQGRIFDRAYKHIFGGDPKRENEKQLSEYVPDEHEAGETAKNGEHLARETTLALGRRVLALIETRGEVQEIRRVMDRFLSSLRITEDLLPEKSLAYLIHPGLSGPGEAPNHLIEEFPSNLKDFIHVLEQEDPILEPKAPVSTLSGEDTDEDAPRDVYLSKILCAMAISANHEGLHFPALGCCKVARSCTRNPTRLGGIYALEAGVLNRMRRYREAEESARSAVSASRGYNSQAYLQGATALVHLQKPDAARLLLDEGLGLIQDSRSHALEALRKQIEARAQNF